MKINISKQVFINNFVTQCCSNYFMSNYNDYCSRGLRENLSNPPLEDIYFSAEEIWKKLENDDENEN